MFHIDHVHALGKRIRLNWIQLVNGTYLLGGGVALKELLEENCSIFRKILLYLAVCVVGWIESYNTPKSFIIRSVGGYFSHLQ